MKYSKKVKKSQNFLRFNVITCGTYVKNFKKLRASCGYKKKGENTKILCRLPWSRAVGKEIILKYCSVPLPTACTREQSAKDFNLKKLGQPISFRFLCHLPLSTPAAPSPARNAPPGPRQLPRRGAWPVATEVASQGDDPLARN